jgi:hypothetical protein
MNPPTAALLCMILAAATGCAPALAAPVAHSAALGWCTPAVDADYRVLRVADSAAPGGFAGGPVAAMQDSDDMPKRLESVALRQDGPRPLPGAAQAGNDGRKEQWLRLPESGAIPEPGLWALLLAGFLGICAVARPRIFSS